MQASKPISVVPFHTPVIGMHDGTPAMHFFLTWLRPADNVTIAATLTGITAGETIPRGSSGVNRSGLSSLDLIDQLVDLEIRNGQFPKSNEPEIRGAWFHRDAGPSIHNT